MRAWRDLNWDQKILSEAGTVQLVDSMVRPTGVEPVTPRSVVPIVRIVTNKDQK